MLGENHLPIKPNDRKKITVISTELQKIATVMDDKQCVGMLEKETRVIHKNTEDLVVKLDPCAEDIQAVTILVENSNVIVEPFPKK